MKALKLLARLLAYYAMLAAAVGAALWLIPAWREYLPVGRVQTLLTQAGGALQKGQGGLQIAHVTSLGGSMAWLVSAVVGALLTSLPVSWVYMEVRDSDQYDQSLIGTIVMLPVVITGIVVIVQNSLALSFSLAGIAGAVRFRNSLKSSGDLLFILLSIGTGLCAGIGALELAFISTRVFNLCFVALWAGEYGERRGMKRYMADFIPDNEPGERGRPEVVLASVSTTVVEGDVTINEAPPAKPRP